MAYKFNPFTGKLDNTGKGTDSDAAGGSNTQIQFNDNGALGGDAELTYNKSTNKLTAGGDVELNDGGSFTTTLQTVTPTANRTISLPNATGTVGLVAGSTTQIIQNLNGAYAGVSTLTADSNGNITLAGRLTNTYTSIADNPAKRFTGTWFTGGTATTTKPHFLIEPSGATSTAWSTSGTGLGVNAASGFAGNLLDLQVNGTSRVNVDTNGQINIPAPVGSTPLGVFVTQNIRLGWNDGGFGGAVISSGGLLAWSSQANPAKDQVADLRLARDAANTLAQRNGTNAQKTNIYDTYTSATDYHRLAIATARATLTNVSGASVTATGLIPAGAVVMGVTSKVTTALGTANGTTGYKIGTGADDDRWGAITGTAAGTTSDNRNWTAGTIECFPAATDVIVTATGGNFNATGVIYLSVQYMAGEAD